MCMRGVITQSINSVTPGIKPVRYSSEDSDDLCINKCSIGLHRLCSKICLNAFGKIPLLCSFARLC